MKQNTIQVAAQIPGALNPVGRIAVPVMISVIIGAVLGFLSGLGIGGGSLLILWLTLVQKLDTETARGINLLFFLPTALIAGFFRWKQGVIPFRKIMPAILLGCFASLMFSFLSIKLNVENLKKLFGGLLILTGMRELFYKPKTNGEDP